MDIFDLFIVWLTLFLISIPVIIISLIVSDRKRRHTVIKKAMFIGHDVHVTRPGETSRTIIGGLAYGTLGAILGGLSTPEKTTVTLKFKVTWEDGSETVETCSPNSYAFYRYLNYLPLGQTLETYTFSFECAPHPLLKPRCRLEVNIDGSARLFAPDGVHLASFPKEHRRTVAELLNSGWLVHARVKTVTDNGDKQLVTVTVKEGLE